MIARYSFGEQAQRGTALLALLVFLVMGALTLFVSQANKSRIHSNAAAGVTAASLAQAKEALIGRSIADENRPGSLPCPDMVTNISNNVPGDGIADLLVGNECPSYIGWLPWRTLGLPELRDSAGERLWYALSRSLRDDTSAQPINATTSCNLTVNGTPQIAAIIFASGPPLQGQIGRPSNNVADYLDGDNADGDSLFSTSPATESFNDRALAITRDELFYVVKRRVVAQLRGVGSPASDGFLKYAADFGVFPWADTDGDGIQDPPEKVGAVPSVGLSFPPWITSNGWLSLVNYEIDAGQTTMSVNIDGMSMTCSLASCQGGG